MASAPKPKLSPEDIRARQERDQRIAANQAALKISEERQRRRRTQGSLISNAGQMGQRRVLGVPL